MEITIFVKMVILIPCQELYIEVQNKMSKVVILVSLPRPGPVKVGFFCILPF